MGGDVRPSVGEHLYFDNVYIRSRDAGYPSDNFLEADSPRGGMSLFTYTILTAWGALVRGYTETKVINRMAKLFCPKVGKLGISGWFEIVPSVFNPADAPTRDAPLPSPLGGNLSLNCQNP